MNPELSSHLKSWVEDAVSSSSRGVLHAATQAWTTFREDSATADGTHPVDQATLCFFVTWLLQREGKNYKVGTVRSYLNSVLRHLRWAGVHVDLGDQAVLAELLKAAKRKRPPAPRKREPLTTVLLADIVPEPDAPALAHMCFTVLSTGVNALARLGELVPKSKKEATFLRRKHAKLHQASGHVSIHLEQSKTDTDAQGVDLLVFKGAEGATHCPVAAIVKAVGKFRRKGKLAHRDRPLFEDPTQKGTSVTRTQVISFLRTRLRAKGYDPAHYCGHSCRKGGAQSLHDAGIDIADIRCAGRWAQGSDSVRLYRTVTLAQRKKWAQALAQPHVVREGIDPCVFEPS